MLNHKQVITILCLVFVVNFGFSQFITDDYQLQFGNSRKSTFKDGKDVIIGTDADGMYVMAVTGNDYHFFYYGNDMSVIKDNELELTFQKHKLTYEYVVQMNGKMYVLASYLNKRENEKLLFSYTLNKDLLTLSSPKLINVSSYKGFSTAQVPLYQFKRTDAETQLLCKINLPVKNIRYTKFSVAVFDSQMDSVWASSNFFFDDKKAPFEMVDLQMGENSKAYVLMKQYDKSKTYRKMDVNYSFKMWVFDSVSLDTYKEIELTIIGQHVSELTFEVVDGGGFQVVGLYSDKYYNQRGVLKYDFDGDYNLVNEFSYVFSTEFIIQYDTPKEREKLRKQAESGNQVALTFFVIDDLIKNEDGSLTLVAEQYQQYRTVNTDANTGTTFTEHYELGKIMLIKFNLENGIEWLEQIPKEQYTINDFGFYSGYSIAQLTNGELVIVFNDEPKNNYYQSNGKLYRWNGSKRKTDVIMYQVGVEGRVKRSKLFNAADEGVISQPSGARLTRDNQFILMGKSRNSMTYIKLTFDND